MYIGGGGIKLIGGMGICVGCVLICVEYFVGLGLFLLFVGIILLVELVEINGEDMDVGGENVILLLCVLWLLGDLDEVVFGVGRWNDWFIGLSFWEFNLVNDIWDGWECVWILFFVIEIGLLLFCFFFIFVRILVIFWFIWFFFVILFVNDLCLIFLVFFFVFNLDVRGKGNLVFLGVCGLKRLFCLVELINGLCCVDYVLGVRFIYCERFVFFIGVEGL